MAKIEGTWDDVFGKADPSVRAIAAELRQLVLKLHPEAIECAYPGYNGVNFGFGKKMNTQAYLYLIAQRDRINLGFFYGTRLADPKGLLEGTGKALRHIKVKSLAVAADPDVAALIKAAIEERIRALKLAQ